MIQNENVYLYKIFLSPSILASRVVVFIVCTAQVTPKFNEGRSINIGTFLFGANGTENIQACEVVGLETLYGKLNQTAPYKKKPL